MQEPFSSLKLPVSVFSLFASLSLVPLLSLLEFPALLSCSRSRSTLCSSENQTRIVLGVTCFLLKAEAPQDE